MLHYALIGRNIGYSLSPEIHNRAFMESGIDASYELCDMRDLRSFHEVMGRLDGANVTVPYKREVIPLLDRLTPEAEAIGAVNTIYREKGKLIGANTDWIGFLGMLDREVTKTAKALILGTGGAANAVAYALRTKGIDSEMVTHGAMEETKVSVSGFDIVINATPCALPNIDYEGINEKMAVMDLRYTPTVTPFMDKAKERGAKAKNGMLMLEEQASASRGIWLAHI